MMSKKHIVLNIVANILSFIISAGISFFLTQYIAQSLGKEAYGFVGLGNNFIGYVTIMTAALNSMASRFIAVKVFESDIDGANKYFSSVIIANCFLAIIILILAIGVVLFIDRLVVVPRELLFDVQLMLGLNFLNFLLSLCFNVFSVAIFIKNKLYLNSLRQMAAQIIRCLLLLTCFLLFPAQLWYLGIAAIVMTLYTTAYNIKYSKTLLPEMHMKIKCFEFSAIKELLSSGIWNSFVQLQSVLMEGLDLLLANLFLGPAEMGVLAITKVVPSYFTQLNSLIAPSFSPPLFKLFAEKEYERLTSYIIHCNKIIGLVIGVPIAVFLAFGKEFFLLWIPSEDATLLWILSVLAICPMFVGGFTRMLYDTYIVTNKLKIPSMVSFALSVINAVLVYFFLQTTNFGLYILAGTSSALQIVRLAGFNPFYAAKCLGLKWQTFYPAILRGAISIITLYTLGLLVKHLFVADTWLLLFCGICITALTGFLLNLFIILNKGERTMLITTIKNRIGRNKVNSL